jgi:hypothetical protein
MLATQGLPTIPRKISRLARIWEINAVASASIHCGTRAMFALRKVIFYKLVELQAVHQDGGEEYQVDGNPRFHSGCQPTEQRRAANDAVFHSAGERAARNPVNHAQVVGRLALGTQNRRKIAKSAVNLNSSLQMGLNASMQQTVAARTVTIDWTGPLIAGGFGLLALAVIALVVVPVVSRHRASRP